MAQFLKLQYGWVGGHSSAPVTQLPENCAVRLPKIYLAAGYWWLPRSRVQTPAVYVEQIAYRFQGLVNHAKWLDCKGRSVSQADREAPVAQKLALLFAEKVTHSLFHHCAANLGN